MSESDYKMRKLKLMNGNTIWVNPITYRNMAKILKYLKDRSEKVSRHEITLSKLSSEVGIERRSIKTAVMLLAIWERPRVKFRASHYGKRTCTKVSFLSV